MMSTASGALIAAATVASSDVVPFVKSWRRRGLQAGMSVAAQAKKESNPEHDIAGNRMWVLGLGVLAVLVAILLNDVVVALTIAYDILVGGLLVAILGGLTWKRGTGPGAAVSMIAGSVVTLGTLAAYAGFAIGDGIYANEPIYFGLIASAVSYVVVSLLTKPTDPAVMPAWEERVAGRVEEEVPVEGPGASVR